MKPNLEKLSYWLQYLPIKDCFQISMLLAHSPYFNQTIGQNFNDNGKIGAKIG